MQTKAITLTIVFAALTMALNPDITKIAFPAPYAPFLIYQIWEIPIVAAALLVNIRSALAISALNAVVLFAIFQGVSPLGPFYNLAATLAMLVGMYLAHLLFYKKLTGKEAQASWKYNTTLAVVYTAFGIIFRTGLMTVLNYVVLPYPPPVGFSLTGPILVDYYVPVVAIFNATLALYTIPLGYSIAVLVKRNLHISSLT